MEEWITQELERTELGDARRTKRLIKIVENLTAKPEASVALFQWDMGPNESHLRLLGFT